MPILSQHTQYHHVHTYKPHILTRVYSAATITTDPTTTRRKTPNIGIDNNSKKSTRSHRVWLTSGCTALLVSLAKSVVGAADTGIYIEPVIAGLLGYFFADLGSGVYHWAIDNYGDASTPVFGSQIDAFQGHHKWPWTITKREFANNLHSLGRVITFVVVPVDVLVNDPVVHAFFGMSCGCIMFSQQFHAWAHGTKSRLPPIVVALQDAGVLISRLDHAEHHRQPYNNNYCIVSGVWNGVLDELMVFQALEMALFFRFGVQPRSWSEPNLDWVEETELSSRQST
ncbi:hypothetical protein GIB67_011402 [Kingdonia uniflora]|uniref:Lipid desaturase domain-containing protein n=1 Tax=Kingdonia uniflora TaxID=39325 RepID=A0A7J7NLE0_9MAGN|nr:hypothetical protein GIB67_011402 [Kingdonia uniflora]